MQLELVAEFTVAEFTGTCKTLSMKVTFADTVQLESQHIGSFMFIH